jgi:hypothetical protein
MFGYMDLAVGFRGVVKHDSSTENVLVPRSVVTPLSSADEWGAGTNARTDEEDEKNADSNYYCPFDCNGILAYIRTVEHISKG